MPKSQAVLLTLGESQVLRLREEFRLAVASIPEPGQPSFARSFAFSAIEHYWQHLGAKFNHQRQLAALPCARPGRLSKTGLRKIAQEFGELASQMDPLFAGYLIGTLYTLALPRTVRSRLGAYYTPPALASRLLDRIEQAGVDWASAHVLDPACGGGAFLAPVALRMRAACPAAMPPAEVLSSIVSRLTGWEIDPFAAWISQVTLEAALYDLLADTQEPMPCLVEVKDSLAAPPQERMANSTFDVVVGNPPYGRVTLSPELRTTYARSLYGHANVYGLFTDLGLRLTRPAGCVAYVTPTSFLGGEYFKRLRALLLAEAPPLTLDFVAGRKGVFPDVLQETLLATYHKDGRPGPVRVAFLDAQERRILDIQEAGSFTLSLDQPQSPWILPREPQLAAFVQRLHRMPGRLADLGYEVSTGPLVWNRVKAHLKAGPGQSRVPVLWAECISRNGSFRLDYQKRQHASWFEPGPHHESLLVRAPCVLVQRTTAKEQSRRLIAAEMPQSLLREYRAVTVENHVNMVKPANGRPAILPKVIAALLNSDTIDRVFRCLSGSVAVSATELEAMPLPSVQELAPLVQLVERKAPRQEIEAAIAACYMEQPINEPAATANDSGYQRAPRRNLSSRHASA